MCGIVGVLSTKYPSELENNVRSMVNTLEHRGPDDIGVWSDSKLGVSFGHSRLSIVDLSAAGHQPMFSSCGRYVIVFNGEIYNHLALRIELDKRSVSSTINGDHIQSRWKGHSDTETLLECISEWGIEKTLQESIGMFAFAIWDLQRRTLTLARDRFGEKPLYYGWVNGDFVFGSELKPFQIIPKFNNPINRDVLALYFQYCAVPSPYSIYEDIFKLEPGNFLTLQHSDLDQKVIKIESYWQLTDAVSRGYANPIDNELEAVATLESLLSESVSQQAVADVPLGVFLSGGVDSSTIAALMQKQSSQSIQTFTVGFDKADFDESSYALAVARHLGTYHSQLHVSPDDVRAVIPKLPEFYDEPFADSSQIPTYLVCQAARKHVTVALSGDAGDELFGGYNRYFWGQRIWRKMSWMPSSLRGALGYSIQGISIDRWDSLSRILPSKMGIRRMGDKAHKLAYRLKSVDSLDDLYRSLVNEWPSDIGLVLGAKRLSTKLDDTEIVKDLAESEHRMMLWDSLTYLPDDILTKVDRAAMSVSLETRIPFLDHRVAELAWRIPKHMKIRNGQGKWVLRQVLYKYVPRNLIERPKAGFGVPVGQWLRGPLREWAESLLEASRLQHEGYLNVDLVRQVWKEHLSGKSDWTARIWAILMFQAWLEVQKVEGK